LLIASIAALTLLGGTGAASASATTQSQIDAILAKRPNATQTSKDAVTFGNGVKMKFGAAAEGEESCEADWFCLWEHDHFGGIMVYWPAEFCGITWNLKEFAFNDMASSWADHTGKNYGTPNKFGIAWDDYGAAGGKLFTMVPGLNSLGLPKELNDKASSVTC